LPAVWPIAVPVLIGGVALYRLLPRPRATLVFGSGVLGALALLLAGVLVAHVEAVTPETVLFYAFSALAIISGTMLVTQKHPARAALSFALVILSTCGLFLLLGGSFLMAATIIIYAGAIIVTFLFVLMLAQQAGIDNADARSREPFLATCSGFLLLFLLLYLLQQSYGTGPIDHLVRRTREVKTLDSTEAMDRQVGEAGGPSQPEGLFSDYKSLFNSHGWKDLRDQVEDLELTWPGAKDGATLETRSEHLDRLEALAVQARGRLSWLQPDRKEPDPSAPPLSHYSGPPPTVAAEEVRRDDAGRPRLPADNPAYLGRSLFTDYLVPVELGGLLLLVAAVGAIAIAQRRPPERTA
jgi:NADH:ubiquinone oxidoreductase subunit 6 (subunit J)